MFKNTIKALIVIVIIVTSCKNKNEGFSINGHIDGINDKTLIVLLNKDNTKLDSTFSNNQTFIFEGVVKHPSSYKIKCKEQYAEIWVENIKMNFKTDIKDIELHSIIKGGNEQQLSNELKKLRLPCKEKLIDISEKIKNQKHLSKIEKIELFKDYGAALKSFRKVVIDFGIAHSNSYLGLSLLYTTKNKISEKILNNLYENLSPSFKLTQDAQSLKKYLTSGTVNIGEHFIDFEAKTIDDNNFKLSSLKGNYIYLTFWSSSCHACRDENLFFSKSIGEIPENLKIVSFSIDKRSKNWKTASKKDNITWTNISDGEGARGKIKNQYKIQSLPTSYLIDKEGIIIKKISGFYGENTLKFIQSYIEKHESGEGETEENVILDIFS